MHTCSIRANFHSSGGRLIIGGAVIAEIVETAIATAMLADADAGIHRGCKAVRGRRRLSKGLIKAFEEPSRVLDTNGTAAFQRIDMYPINKSYQMLRGSKITLHLARW